MNLREQLNTIRPYKENSLSKGQVLKNIVLFFTLGIVLGILSKYMDTVSSNSAIGNLINIIANIFSDIQVWVLIATIISAWSKTPLWAALNVLLFFCGMLLSYYIYSAKLFGFFPSSYFIYWGIIALFSAFAAYVMWYSRGEGLIAAILAALPIGLLMCDGYSFLYLFNISSGFSLISAIFLCFILPINKKQIIKILPFIIIITFIFRQSSILNYIFGVF